MLLATTRPLIIITGARKLSVAGNLTNIGGLADLSVTKLRETDAKLVAESGWLSVVPEKLRSRIVDACTTRSVKRRDFLWHFGDVVDGLYLIRSGCIRAETSESEHGPAMLTILHQGSWIGEAEILGGTGRITTMSALRDCSLLFLSRSDLLALSRQYPEVWRGLGYLASEHMYLAIAGMYDLMIRSSPARVAAVLLRICGARVPAFPGIPATDLDVTQTELGQLCNLSRSVVSTMLDDFEKRGLIGTRYGRVEILDLHALADEAGVKITGNVA